MLSALHAVAQVVALALLLPLLSAAAVCYRSSTL
jgi:hypothetical protein